MQAFFGTWFGKVCLYLRNTFEKWTARCTARMMPCGLHKCPTFRLSVVYGHLCDYYENRTQGELRLSLLWRYFGAVCSVCITTKSLSIGDEAGAGR